MAESLGELSRRRRHGVKKRIKKSNKAWRGLGRARERPAARAKGAGSSAWLLKSIQANNRALALALQEEKLKVREARDAIKCLKGENQRLRFQISAVRELFQTQTQHVRAPAESLETFPPVRVTISVVTGQERYMAALQHEEIPESETKATAVDNKPAGCLSEDCCELASANAVREGDRECGILEETCLEMSVV